jgi:hypothetical protein
LTKAGKLYRITFSKSLAEHIQRYCGPENLQIERVTFEIGRTLAPGEPSRSGLYAITSTRKDLKPLRITLFADAAALMTPDHWREIHECWLVP